MDPRFPVSGRSEAMWRGGSGSACELTSQPEGARRRVLSGSEPLDAPKAATGTEAQDGNEVPQGSPGHRVTGQAVDHFNGPSGSVGV